MITHISEVLQNLKDSAEKLRNTRIKMQNSDSNDDIFVEYRNQMIIYNKAKVDLDNWVNCSYLEETK